MADEQDLITSYIDLSAVGAQTDAFLAQIKQLDNAYTQLGAKSISLGGLQGGKEIVEAIKELQADLARLEAAKQKVINVDKEAAAAAKAEAQARRDAAAAVRAKANADKEAAAAAAQEKKIVDDLANEYKQLTLAYNEAALRAKNLGIVYGSNSVQFKEAAANASALKDQIRQLDLATGNTSTSIGRYNEGIKEVAVVSGNAFAGISKFYGFLRIAANIIPGLGISGIFLAGFEAIKFAAQGLGFFNDTVDKSAEKIAKQKKKLQELIDSFRDINEISAAGEGSAEGSIVHVQALAAAVTDQTKTYVERNRALTELKEINKAYFGDLTVETATIAALTKIVNEYTDALINQAILKELEGDIGKVTVAYSRQIKVVKDLNNQVKDVQALFDSLDPNKLPSQQGITNKTLNNFIDLKNNLKDQALALIPLSKQYDALRQEIFDATEAGLKFKDVSKGAGNDNSTRLKTFDAKENEDAAKRFIQLEKDVSANVETELAARTQLRADAYGREFNLLVESTEREKKVAQDAANDVFNDPKANANTKINAQRKLNADLETIHNNFNAADLKLVEDFNRDYDKIQATARVKRLADEKADNELFAAIEKARIDNQVKLQAKIASDRTTITSASKSSELDFLNEEYGKGLISTEKYQQQKLAIQQRYEIRALQDTVDNAQILIDNAKTNGVNVLDQEKIIYDARLKLSNQLTDALVANENKLRDERKKITNDIVSGIGTLVDDSFEKDKNNIQAQIDLLNVKKQKEIEAVNNSVATEQDKAAQIAIINARADAQQQALEKRQKDADVKKAEFDKIISEIQIAINTAQAVQQLSVKAAEARAQGALLTANPVTAAYASVAYASAGAIAAQIPIVIAQGIIAAALVAARPIPRYKMGTMNHPGGMAEVGHGQPEYVLTPGGNSFVTGSTPVQMDLPKGTKVYPDLNKLPSDIMRMAMKDARKLPGVPDASQMLAGAMARGFGSLTNAVLNKQETHFHWSNGELQKSHKNGNAWTTYKNRMV